MTKLEQIIRALAPLALAAAAACGEGPVGTLTRVRILGTGGGSDTILAMASQPMLVEVRDQLGEPAAGVDVVFYARHPGTDTASAERGMYVCAPTRSPCSFYVNEHNYDVWTAHFATTDAQGHARANVQFGTIAGPAVIEVRVQELDFVREVQFTTLPGALARVVAAAADTAVYVGSSYDLGARAADRFGNARAEAVTLTSLTPAVATVTDGRLTAQSLGRGRVLMQVGTIRDTAYVSVPPPGRLVMFGWALDRSSMRRLTLINTDGSGRRLLFETPGDNGNANPIWTPDGSRVVFQETPSITSEAQLHVTDTLGNRQPFVSGVSQSLQAAASDDSVYFYGAQGFAPAGIFRVAAQGGTATFLFSGVQPGPSPDNSQVAHVVGDSLRVRDMTTAATRTIAAHPTFPRWSPAGDLIAFVSNDGDAEVRVVRPDATGLRVVGPGLHDRIVSWSPDGAWLATARYEGGLELIRIADGERLPIAGTEDLFEPAWRP